MLYIVNTIYCLIYYTDYLHISGNICNEIYIKLLLIK